MLAAAILIAISGLGDGIASSDNELEAQTELTSQSENESLQEAI